MLNAIRQYPQTSCQCHVINLEYVTLTTMEDRPEREFIQVERPNVG